MATATARPGPMRSFSLTAEDQSSSSSSSTKLRNTLSNTSSEEGGSNNGILCNAHEAPARNGKMNGTIGSKLKAAFTHNQPGKQVKPKNSPIGKTFHREQPLQNCHAGGEVLKVDPRGPDANVGDGVVLSPNKKEDENEEEEGDEFETPTSPGAMSSSNDGTYSESESNDYLSLPLSNQSNGRRSRSNTASTEVSESGSSVCKIKFAPLPTSGRLKRANSITIGVAARSQLLQSQGAGRQQGGANPATAWQQVLQQQQQQYQNQQQSNHNSQNPSYYQSNNPSRYSGIQPIQEQESQESFDSGESLLKGASKAWNRIRRGSSVSNSSSNGNAASKPRVVENGVSEEAIDDVDEGEKSNTAINDGGENTPKRAQSPTNHHLDESEPDGAKTPKREMSRRVSTGTFIGHQSLRQMEERRKRGDDQKSSRNYKDDERQNDATRFIEMLGRTGQGNESFHHADNVQIKSVENDKYISSDFSESGSEQSQSGMSQSGEEEEDDDEETLEAERLADQALKGHSEKAIKAGGVEKMEKRRPSFGFKQKK